MKKLIIITALIFAHLGCESDEDSASTNEDGSPSSQALIAGSTFLDSLEPSSGSTGGNESISIFGSGFTADTSVYFGDKICTETSVQSELEIQCITPANPAGYVSVTVTNGTGSETKENLFQYIEPNLALVVTKPDPLPKYIGSHDANSRTLLLEHDATVECAIDSGDFTDCTTSGSFVIPVGISAPGHTVKIKAVLSGTDDVIQTINTDDLYTGVTLLTCDQTVSDDLTFAELNTLISNASSDDILCFDENVIIENNDSVADSQVTVDKNISLVGTVLNEFEINGLRDSGGAIQNSIFEIDGAVTMKLYNSIMQAHGNGGSAFYAGSGNPSLFVDRLDLNCDTSDGFLMDGFGVITIENSKITQLTPSAKAILKAVTNNPSITLSVVASELESIGDTPINIGTSAFTLNFHLDNSQIMSRAPVMSITGGGTKNIQLDSTTFKVTGGGASMIASGSMLNPTSTENGNLACNATGGGATSIFTIAGGYESPEWDAANSSNGTIPTCP